MRKKKISAIDRAVKQAAERIWKKMLSDPPIELYLAVEKVQGTALLITVGQKIRVGDRTVQKRLSRTFYHSKPTRVPAIYVESFLEYGDGLLARWEEKKNDRDTTDNDRRMRPVR